MEDYSNKRKRKSKNYCHHNREKQQKRLPEYYRNLSEDLLNDFVTHLEKLENVSLSK